VKTKGDLELPRFFLLLLHTYYEGVRTKGVDIHKKYYDFKCYSYQTLAMKRLTAMGYLICEKGGDIKKYNGGQYHTYFDKRIRFYSITPKGLEFAKVLERYQHDSIKYIEAQDATEEQGGK